MAENKQLQDHVVELLMAEYDAMTQEFRRLRSEGLNRLNFFITLTSAVIGGLVLLNQAGPAPSRFIDFASIGSLTFLLLIGLDTFRFAISRDINTDLNLRAIGRIRRFFAHQSPSLEKHLTWQNHDEPTKWVTSNTSGIRRTTQSILSLLFALLVGLIANLVTTDSRVLIAVGVVVFVVTLLGFRGYASWRYQKATESALKSVRFPRNKD
jgi:hypothetical protein